MPADPLTPAISARICTHMNDDHAEAVLDYARHYGGIETPESARMVAVMPDSMELEVDGRSLQIPFDLMVKKKMTPTTTKNFKKNLPFWTGPESPGTRVRT